MIYNIIRGGKTMLIEFSVKNFLSFREKVTLSMEKGTGDENQDNVIDLNDIEILKIASIYGANASGKSSFLKAFTCAILMIRNSTFIPLNGKWMFLKPFLFDDESKKKPTEFEFVFISNDIKYKYSFSADVDKIYSESLEAYYSQKSTTIFSRNNINKYKFLIPDEAKLKSIVSKNTDNKLFLSTASNWNYDKTKDAYLWFMNSIDTYDSLGTITTNDLKSYSENDLTLKKFTLKLLKESDIFIKDFNVDYEEKEMDNLTRDMIIPPMMQSVNNPTVTNIKIELIHEIKTKDNKTKTYNLNFDDESSGTKILFALAPFLKRAFEETKIIIIDELEKSLHPTLVEYLIKIFNNNKINKAGSQLIFTTHATNLLNLKILRRDQIWFVEKNPENCVSDLYPLDSFSVRKNENIEKGYINGRYGAIPFINDINLWQEETK